ncbi:MAG: TIGR00282 family metallophosphoesterase [Acholeplasmataceae bacterium]
MKILFIGDIYGEPGVNYLIENLKYLKQEYHPNLIIANAENSSNGRGINKEIYKKLMKSGVSLLTMGNHTWKNPALKTFIEESNIIRPINDGSNLGVGYKVINYNNIKVLVINALGVAFMNEKYEAPYLMIEKVLNEIPHDYSFLDFHAEATAEKIALAYYLDGKLDMMVGTHTHVQTNDQNIYPKGLMYITDVGMTGPKYGVIGVKKEVIINRFIFGGKEPNEVAKGPRQLSAVLFTLTPKKSIKKIYLSEN